MVDGSSVVGCLKHQTVVAVDLHTVDVRKVACSPVLQPWVFKQAYSAAAAAAAALHPHVLLLLTVYICIVPELDVF